MGSVSYICRLEGESDMGDLHLEQSVGIGCSQCWKREE
jgi:hypothetical protein